jgi:hypothetical protein
MDGDTMAEALDPSSGRLDTDPSADERQPGQGVEHAPWCTRVCHLDTGTDDCASAVTIIAGAVCLWLVRGDVHAPGDLAAGRVPVRADRVVMACSSVTLDGVARDQLVDTLQGYQLGTGAGLN